MIIDPAIAKVIFLIGCGGMGLIFPEFLCLYSTKKFNGLLVNLLCAVSFQCFGFYFVS
jgi:hypothetical protein